jgi:hypothetical protein
VGRFFAHSRDFHASVVRIEIGKATEKSALVSEFGQSKRKKEEGLHRE